MKPTLKPYLAEWVGTFILVFAGTGAIVVNQTTQGSVTHPGVALVFGLVVFALIQTFGPVSGCHINPAVSLAAVLWGKLPISRLGGYWISQALGAIAASVMLRLLFPGNDGLGGTQPQGGPTQSLILEFFLTLILMLSIIGSVSANPSSTRDVAWTVGAVIGLEAMFAGPICGASMNPFRSLAPALVSGHWEHQWIYVAGPLAGALVGVLLAPWLFSETTDPRKEPPAS